MKAALIAIACLFIIPTNTEANGVPTTINGTLGSVNGHQIHNNQKVVMTDKMSVYIGEGGSHMDNNTTAKLMATGLNAEGNPVYNICMKGTAACAPAGMKTSQGK